MQNGAGDVAGTPAVDVVDPQHRLDELVQMAQARQSPTVPPWGHGQHLHVRGQMRGNVPALGRRQPLEERRQHGAHRRLDGPRLATRPLRGVEQPPQHDGADRDQFALGRPGVPADEPFVQHRHDPLDPGGLPDRILDGGGVGRGGDIAVQDDHVVADGHMYPWDVEPARDRAQPGTHPVGEDVIGDVRVGTAASEPVTEPSQPSSQVAEPTADPLPDQVGPAADASRPREQPGGDARRHPRRRGERSPDVSHLRTSRRLVSPASGTSRGRATR